MKRLQWPSMSTAMHTVLIECCRKQANQCPLCGTRYLAIVHDIGTFLNASALRRARFGEVQRKLIEDRRIAEEESIDVENFVENDDEGSDGGTEDEKISANMSGTGVRKLCATRWLARTPGQLCRMYCDHMTPSKCVLKISHRAAAHVTQISQKLVELLYFLVSPYHIWGYM